MYISMFGRGFHRLFDGWLDAWKTVSSLNALISKNIQPKFDIWSHLMSFTLIILCASLHVCITSINVMLSFVMKIQHNWGFHSLWCMSLSHSFLICGMRASSSWVYTIVSQQAFSVLMGIIIPDQSSIFRMRVLVFILAFLLS